MKNFPFTMSLDLNCSFSDIGRAIAATVWLVFCYIYDWYLYILCSFHCYFVSFTVFFCKQ